MKARKILSVFMSAVLIFSLFGCETMKEHKGAATGAAVGAVVGGTAGALLGKEGAKTETAILGGLVGALIGGAVGHYTYDTKRSGKETDEKYGYQTSMGRMVRVESVSAMPSKVKTGDKVDLTLTYAVMLPDNEQQASVTEVREIRFNNELVGKPEVKVTRSKGTFVSTVPIFLPTDAKKGTYYFTASVAVEGSKDAREGTFIVE